MRKGIAAAFTLLLLACTLLPVVSAAATPRVVVDCQQLTLDVPPTIINGRLLVPMRAIFAALGAEVGWDEPTRTVTAVKGDTEIKLIIGRRFALKNGIQLSLDVPAQVLNGRTLVPLRFVGEALGCEVGWDQASLTASVNASLDYAQMIVGLWSNEGDSAPPADPDTGVVTGVLDDSGCWLWFMPDDTFKSVITINNGQVSGVVALHGGYRLEGLTILLFNQRQDWYPDETSAEVSPAYTDLLKDQMLDCDSIGADTLSLLDGAIFTRVTGDGGASTQQAPPLVHD
jgi:hypothetical protein